MSRLIAYLKNPAVMVPLVVAAAGGVWAIFIFLVPSPVTHKVEVPAQTITGTNGIAIGGSAVNSTMIVGGSPNSERHP